MYIIISKEDGAYHLTTHTMFHTYEAAEAYAVSVSPARFPLIVEYDGQPFRDDAHERFGLMTCGYCGHTGKPDTSYDGWWRCSVCQGC